MLATLRSIRLLTEDIQRLTSLHNTTKDVNTKKHLKEQIDFNNSLLCQLKQPTKDFLQAQLPHIRVAIKEYYFNAHSWEKAVINLSYNYSTDYLRINIARACKAWDSRNS